VYVGVMVSRLYVEDISVFRSSIDMGVVFAAIFSAFLRELNKSPTCIPLQWDTGVYTRKQWDSLH